MKTNKHRTFFRTFPALVLLAAGVSGAQAQDVSAHPFVSPIFGDNMVLQREKPNTIWGWSLPGDVVKVDVGENSATGTAGADGKWQAKLQPPPAGGPYTVKITGKQTVELHDVLVGDVWICSGQSNMQFGLTQARNATEEIKNANYPQIRFFVAGQRAAYSRVDVPRGSWKVVSPSTVGGRGGGISAVAYFFARKLQENRFTSRCRPRAGSLPSEECLAESVQRESGRFASHERFRRRCGRG